MHTKHKKNFNPLTTTFAKTELNNSNVNQMYGLSTKAALGRLADEIEKILIIYEKAYAKQSCYSKLRLAIIKRHETPLNWFSIVTTLLTIIILIVATLYLTAIILAAILLFSLFIVVREHNFRRTEIYRKTRRALQDLRLAEQELSTEWQPCNYAHICCPISPCVSLQWTYRDGVIVNLPWALLVKGDYIVLRPGQAAPGACVEIDEKRSFKINEIYSVSSTTKVPKKPIARTLLPDLVCCLEETPYLDNLKLILENSHKRPPTIYNQQRYLLVTKYLQQWGFICSALITLFSGMVNILGFRVITININQSWKDILMEGLVATVMPILPLIFPIMWISMNLWGVARLQCFLGTPQLLLRKNSEKSFEEDLDTPTFNYENINLERSKVFKYWFKLWQGDSELLPRSANVVQVLGSITALCCIDKKGILSWPNPTAEKVFFLRDTDNADMDGNNSDQSSMIAESNLPNSPEEKKSGIVTEVLDLTHDQHCPFRLEFDDHEWKTHIKSLKPLGLAILLNTCSPLTHTYYAKFCGHVTAVALADKNLVPITNRYAIVESTMKSFLHGRCLCELAKQIGFTDHATDHFTLEGQLASYRHWQPNVVRDDVCFTRQLPLSSKVKMKAPFPHALSVVMRENPAGYLSLFTQGTADIVLDCCDDFWDGIDLRPLSSQDRKRALDFYQRSALTAYCTAFAYRPLRHGINGVLSAVPNGTNNVAYMELPPVTYRTQLDHIDKVQYDFECGHAKLSHSISTDSLLFSESKEEDISDVEGCFEMQSHQVFIGMVTMQYQAQMDIVQLVEHMERACIRFVHFSKENELRSRVFSEKMGLESGWNCHISLLSEQNDKCHPGERELSSQSMEGALDTENLCDNHVLLPSTTTINNLETTKTLSGSAPGAITNDNYNTFHTNSDRNKSLTNSSCHSLNSHQSLNTTKNKSHKRRQSQDSALDENFHSISILTESTEQSAPVHFDMSNRAKLPRGIENIRPHLEMVDNVPLQVSLFTDCSAEATREMLEIMQYYGEIVVCVGSSASNSNAEIFLQADCSIAVEPLYPQVCQDIPAYTESNLLDNKVKYLFKRYNDPCSNTSTDSLSAEEALESGLYGTTNTANTRPIQLPGNTISPIYLSRLLNSLPCSIAVKREDPLSLVAIIELSRRFSSGLWNCIQFWASCAGSLSALNMLSACLSLPCILPPLAIIYLMCVPLPLISLSLAHIDLDKKIMNRATGKKQTKYDTRVFGFVVWCYGCKFMTPVLLTVLPFIALLSHKIDATDENRNAGADTPNVFNNLQTARHFSLIGILMHYVVVSATFVHRDHSIWQRNPLRNHIWSFTCVTIVVIHISICIGKTVVYPEMYNYFLNGWPAVCFLYCSTSISLIIAEVCKWQEIKVNARYQRRARLDFGTKLGMNSPF